MMNPTFRRTCACHSPRSHLLLRLALFAATASLASMASALPDGFQYVNTLSGFNEPTAVRFARDGRVFVAEKSGVIKVFDDLRDSTPTTLVDLRAQVHNYFDRGLLGLALHPQFPQLPYIYVLYSYDGGIGMDDAPRWGSIDADNDDCPDLPAAADGCVIGARLSRLTVNGDVAVAETVLVEDWYQQHPTHSIGTLQFGADGYLYAGAGEGSSSAYVDSGEPPHRVYPDSGSPVDESGALRAQDLETAGDPVGLSGAIIRIDPMTGAAAADNPLAGHDDPNAARIVAYGLRNPFRFAMRPGSSEVWIGDVGWEHREELNVLPEPATASAPVNFGWPCFEGSGRQAGYELAELPICTRLYAGQGQQPHTAPYLALDRTQAGSLSTIAFYRGDNWPAGHRNAVFFSDFVKDIIYTIPDADADGRPDGADALEVFATGAAGLVELQPGPGGDLFFPNLFDGSLVRLRYGDNTPPTAALTLAAGAQWQGPPRSVGFDGRRSYDPDAGSPDPDAQALAYAWDLDDDGLFDDAATAQAAHAFAAAGSHRVTLRVSDAQGASDTRSMTIMVDAGSSAAAVQIDSPTAATTWRSGHSLPLVASGHAADGSPLPDDAYAWAIVLLHCATGPDDCHQHPLTGVGGRTGAIVPPPHEYPSYLRITLSATTADGVLQDTVDIAPETAPVRLLTEPAGLSLAFGSGGLQATPLERTVIVGASFSVAAPSSQQVAGRSLQFVGWSDGGARQHSVVASSASPLQLTATYAMPDSVFRNGFEAEP